MEEYPKRLYLEDGTVLTVNTAAEEALWRHPPHPPSPIDPPLMTATVQEPTSQAVGSVVKKIKRTGATDA